MCLGTSGEKELEAGGLSRTINSTYNANKEIGHGFTTNTVLCRSKKSTRCPISIYVRVDNPVKMK